MRVEIQLRSMHSSLAVLLSAWMISRTSIKVNSIPSFIFEKGRLGGWDGGRVKGCSVGGTGHVVQHR